MEKQFMLPRNDDIKTPQPLPKASPVVVVAPTLDHLLAELPPLISPRSLAEKWDCSAKTIYRLIKEGELEAIPLTRTALRVLRESAIRFIERGLSGAR